jgi:FkbM family methyltransferase
MLSALRRLVGLPARLPTYDDQTIEVMNRVLKPNSVTVDVGAHVGSVLRELVRRAPEGSHFAFEPIPACFGKLQKRFGNNRRVTLFPYALAAEAGPTTFQHVVSRPTYSGLQRRRYEREEDIVEIHVQCARLDDVIPASVHVDFIKIDVEGGEYGVLRGGIATLRRCKPVVVFEHGVGGADHYGVEPEQVFDLLHHECGLALSLMTRYLANDPPLDRVAFCDEYRSQRNYYFMAYSV